MHEWWTRKNVKSGTSRDPQSGLEQSGMETGARFIVSSIKTRPIDSVLWAQKPRYLLCEGYANDSAQRSRSVLNMIELTITSELARALAQESAIGLAIG
jgi:hypothetical protein